MPETQNIRNDNAHEQGIRFLSLLNLMTLRFFQNEKAAFFNGDPSSGKSGNRPEMKGEYKGEKSRESQTTPGHKTFENPWTNSLYTVGTTSLSGGMISLTIYLRPNNCLRWFTILFVQGNHADLL